jgi:hypothetical protein
MGEVGGRGKFGGVSRLIVVALFVTKNKRKKKQWHACVVTFFTSNRNKKMKEKTMASSFFQTEEKEKVQWKKKP